MRPAFPFCTLLSALIVSSLFLVPASGAGSNRSPTVALPGNFSVESVEPFTLDGSNSFDIDGDPIFCEWSQSWAPPGHFENRTNCTTTFVPEGSGVFHFRLTVRDPTGVNLTAASPWTDDGVVQGDLIVAVANRPPHFVSVLPAAGEVNGEEGIESISTGHSSMDVVTPSDLPFRVVVFDPDEGNRTVTWFVDGQEVPWGDVDEDMGGNSTYEFRRMQGTYRLRATTDDGAANESVEWEVHISARGVAGVAPFFAGPAGVALIVGPVITIGAVFWLWRRARA